MTQDTQSILPFARLCGKTLQADFDGGTLSSDGGVLFLRETEAQVGIIRRFVEALDDRRDARYIDYSQEELLRQRIFQIACGYEDANDCNSLRRDPAFKAACERLPIVGENLASQPTMSRLENAPRRSELYRIAQALLDTFLASYERAPKALLLDIDDTADEVHGAQQQSLFNGYYDAYCYLPLHIYEGQSGKLITSILRPGRRPTGKEIVSILKRVVGAIRHEWPEVLILLRGDGHFSTPEVQQWCESQEPVVFYILGQIRFVVTNLETPRNGWIYELLYCGRGQMENYIKDHKLFLHSDRTSCHKFEANQFRVFLHSAAYVLMHTLRTKGLRGTIWAKAQFDQIQIRLLKVATRVEELKTKVKFHFPSSFPLQEIYEAVLLNLSPSEWCRSP